MQPGGRQDHIALITNSFAFIIQFGHKQYNSWLCLICCSFTTGYFLHLFCKKAYYFAFYFLAHFSATMLILQGLQYY